MVQNFQCAQDPGIPVWFIWEVPDPVDGETNGHMDERTVGRTDIHSSNALEFRADQMSARNLGSQINISMRPTRIHKTNIPYMRRV